MIVCKILGVDTDLEVFEDKLTITPKGVLGFLNKGLKGSKTIPFTSITAVQHKRAGFTTGYLQFTLLGGIESRGGIFAAIEDENTFVFREADNALAEQVKAFIEQKICELKNPVTPPSAPVVSTSPVDELVKLANLKAQGLLSEDEYSKAKQKVLGMK
jgi:hypothetical protein